MKMLPSDIIISKLKLKSKLKDRKRTKGFSFSYSQKEENCESPFVKQFRKERMERKALNEKEIKILRNNLIQIRIKKYLLENKDKNKKNGKMFTQLNQDTENKVSFYRIKYKKFRRQKNPKDEEFNIKNNKEKIKEKSDRNEINKIITDIKNNSYNLYKILNNTNLKEKIFKNNENNNIKFYKNFLGLFKHINKSSSAKNIKSKFISRFNQMKNYYKYDTSSSEESKNINSNCSSFLGKKINLKKYVDKPKNNIYLDISEQNSEYNINNNNTFLNTFKNINLNNSNDKISYETQKNIYNNSMMPLTNITNRSKSLISIKKDNVINKPMYKKNLKYFLNKFKNIKEKIKNDETKRKERHLATYKKIENFSKIREDMLIFGLKLKYFHTQFPKSKDKTINKKKLLFNKLIKNFDEEEQKNFDLRHHNFIKE